GDGTLLAMATFVAVGLAVGHLLGGPDPADRTVLALCTATRHPGIAIVIATTMASEPTLALGAVLLFVIVNAVVSAPYVAWRRRALAKHKGTTGDAEPDALEPPLEWRRVRRPNQNNDPGDNARPGLGAS